MPVAPEEITAISAIADSVIRNLRITECYHRLSLAMAERTGSGANWCTFATWASRQAGRTIRGEDFIERLSRHAPPGFVALHPVTSLWRVLLRKGIFNPGTALGRFVRDVHSPFDAFERASHAVARGNLKVFQEIGYEFARYLALCPPDAPVHSAAFTGFLEGLRPGPPPEGQDYLRSAFTHCQQALLCSDPPIRAQLLLLANLEIGLHEQTRLQPEIQESLEVLPDTAISLGSRLFRRYRVFAAGVTRRVITEALMELALPDTVLSLGRNLECAFPDVFRDFSYAELRELWKRCEPQITGVDDCGADDWAILSQRMHYIAHLFRAFHFHPALNSSPFTSEQLACFNAGRVPEGRL